MLISEILSRIDHPMQVRFHKVGDDVNVFEIGFGVGSLEIEQGNDVLVIEEFL